MRQLKPWICFFFLFVSPFLFAAPGSLVQVKASGAAFSAPIPVIICLNALSTLSCEKTEIKAARLQILSAAVHDYTRAGIQVDPSTGYQVANCDSIGNGFCKLSMMSNTMPATVRLVKQVSKPPILFVASTLTQGNFNVNQGADQFCAAAATRNNTAFNPNDYLYSAMIITSKRYPCDYVNGQVGCGVGFASSDWPLAPNTTYYYPDGVTVFNVTNGHGVFDGSNSVLHFEDGSRVDGSHPLFIGIQSELANHQTPPTDYIAWAYADLNPGRLSTNDGIQYTNWSPRNCHDWTDNTGPGIWNAAVGQAGQSRYVVMDPVNPAPTPDTWGNYYIWQNGDIDSTYTFFVNVWSISYLADCPSQGYVVCVASS